jgi:hypothetical protein
MKGGAMTVQELIDELECCDSDAEVRFLAQPSWPFEYTIAAVVEATDRPDDLSGYPDTPARRVLLVEGRQACYGDKGVDVAHPAAPDEPLHPVARNLLTYANLSVGRHASPFAARAA